VLERDGTEEVQDGRVYKVMAEVKDRQGEENEEGNKNATSRPQGSQPIICAIFILHVWGENAKSVGFKIWRR
jgi:hypothetical protein